MMRFLRLLGVLVCTAGFQLAAGSLVKWDFDSTSPIGNWQGLGEDYRIADGDAGNKVLKITRSKPCVLTATSDNADLPVNREYTLSFRYRLTGKAGIWGFRLINSKTNTRVADVMFIQRQAVVHMNPGRATTLYTAQVGSWQQLTLKYTPGNPLLETLVTDENGKTSRGLGADVLSAVPADQVMFFNLPNTTDAIEIDDVELSYADHSPVDGRVNAAVGSEVSISDLKGRRNSSYLNDGMLGVTAFEIVEGFPSTVTLMFPEKQTISSVRLYSGYAARRDNPSTDTSVTSYRVEVLYAAAGQWREVALVQNAPVAASINDPDEQRFSQADFKPLESLGVRITVLSGNDKKLRFNGVAEHPVAIIREIEAYTHHKGAPVVGLAKVLQAEYRLAVYRDQPQAVIDAILPDDHADLPVEISFEERHTKEIPAPPQKFTLKAGLNHIPIDISTWKNGEYRTVIKSSGNVRGEFARLLRLDRIKSEPVVFGDYSGRRMYFPDLDGLTDCRNVQVKIFPAEKHFTGRPFYSGPDYLTQYGGRMSLLPDGRLGMEIVEYNHRWQDRKVFFAKADLKTWQWTFSRQEPAGLTSSSNEFSRSVCSSSGYIPGQGAGSAQYRFYDPEKDGPVKLDQLRVVYTGYKPADWGVIKVPPQTTWTIWDKSKDEKLLLSKEPFLADGVSSNEFESSTDTNDNFSGQYLLPDGTFCYVRGRLLRRCPPHTANYDNIQTSYRILTVFQTRDGLNWERHYFALPDEQDPPAMQHYGASLYLLPRTKGLWLGFQLSYSVKHQQYDNELVYSRDGKVWKRFADRTRWVAAGGIGSPNFGMTNMHNQIFEKDGKYYHQIGYADPLPHMVGEINHNPDAPGNLNGEFVKKKYGKRDITSWPYWNEFGDYDRFTEYMVSNGATCGVAVYRKNGWFGITSEDGDFTTGLLRAKGKLIANFDAASKGAEIEFTLLDSDGRVLQSAVCSGDEVEKTVFETLPEGSFAIRVRLKNATLYTLEFN